MHLIIPAAGKSSRFPNVRPKWMLTHPNGNLMFIEAIRGLNLEDFDNIYLVVLREHIERYNCLDGINRSFERIGIEGKAKVIQLPQPTASQPETVSQALRLLNLNGPIYIKDTDNYFRVTAKGINEVATYSLNRMQTVNAVNKSYVEVNEGGFITNIVEKNVVSSFFCTGGYSFESADTYLKYFDRMENGPDLYISHIIYDMMLDGHAFSQNRVEEYEDWGTMNEWNKFKSSFCTLFVDIDGTLVYNSGEYFEPKWGATEAISENREVINKLFDSGRVHIVLTTCRPLEYREITENQLKDEGIKYHQVIYGLYHARRIIINDYALTNPYKSCDSINLSRDSRELRLMLEGTLGISLD